MARHVFRAIITFSVAVCKEEVISLENIDYGIVHGLCVSVTYVMNSNGCLINTQVLPVKKTGIEWQLFFHRYVGRFIYDNGVNSGHANSG